MHKQKLNTVHNTLTVFSFFLFGLKNAAVSFKNQKVLNVRAKKLRIQKKHRLLNGKFGKKAEKSLG